MVTFLMSKRFTFVRKCDAEASSDLLIKLLLRVRSYVGIIC